MLNKIKPYSKYITGDYQCGFMNAKSTIDHTFTIEQLVEKYYECNKDLHMLLIDYKQAYDTVNREAHWNTLITFEIPSKTMNFYVKSGLRQGDAMSPVLFNIALEAVIKKTQTKYGGLMMDDNKRQYGILAYADDIIILRSDSQEVKTGIEDLIKK
ncbi:Reverse transcriptase domain [Cinara cedri]|uniref:Reverse transcriptase domain n=1 Tax=Cinara cedri TaxID=506608 RepID=A0A5E4MX89_9HEMI|nr:Reverse transcriptase domain [Cinara cedri]